MYLCVRCDFFRLLLNNLVNFFHEDGIGLSFDQMKKLEDYKQLEAELKIRSASTGDLVKMFYLQVNINLDFLLFIGIYERINVFVTFRKKICSVAI